MIDAEMISQFVARIDAWFDSMRGKHGYSGPVAHWWQNCLLYTGVGLDWRYEGIINGYLELYRCTGNAHWLWKAQRAGDDLVRGRNGAGNYLNSSFELNPSTGGTPHEAAANLSLIQLAIVLSQQGNPSWRLYAQVAERNIDAFILGILWNSERRWFCNTAYDTIFVPNKAATTAEMFFALATLRGETSCVERYALPLLDAIIACQIQTPGTRLHGAIEQGHDGRSGTGKYFPFYIARCVPALVTGYISTGQRRYLDAACAATRFILREQLPDGSFPQVIYQNGRTNRYPQWVAGIGDVLRAIDCVREQGEDVSSTRAFEWMMRGQLSSGGIRTAYGFANQGSQRKDVDSTDFRDILPVCGWADKAFRYLTTCLPQGVQIDKVLPTSVEALCSYKGHVATYREDDNIIEIVRGKKVFYRWYKGEPWVDTLVN